MERGENHAQNSENKKRQRVLPHCGKRNCQTGTFRRRCRLSFLPQNLKEMQRRRTVQTARFLPDGEPFSPSGKDRQRNGSGDEQDLNHLCKIL